MMSRRIPQEIFRRNPSQSLSGKSLQLLSDVVKYWLDEERLWCSGIADGLRPEADS